MFWFNFFVICFIILLSYTLSGIIAILIEREYQKLWDKEKAIKIKINPNISRAELCEYYVMFCIRNNCKVDF